MRLAQGGDCARESLRSHPQAASPRSAGRELKRPLRMRSPCEHLSSVCRRGIGLPYVEMKARKSVGMKLASRGTTPGGSGYRKRARLRAEGQSGTKWPILQARTHPCGSGTGCGTGQLMIDAATPPFLGERT